jgi:triphosphoribosyl-dephospho-CoA synthase
MNQSVITGSSYFPEETPDVSISCRLASLARRALIAEVELTPKPGLVDLRGSGSHTDLSLDLMRKSAEVLEPHFKSMADVSMQFSLGRSLREELGRIGRNAEHAMYGRTGGINTHKGAIWLIGLLVAAAAHAGDTPPSQITTTAATISLIPDRARPNLVTHGVIVENRYGTRGARAEANDGFPHVTEIGLPTLRAARGKGRSERASSLCALLAIMTTLDDTCVLYRSGAEGAAFVQAGALAVLSAGGPETPEGDAALLQLDQDLIDRNISPGGSADLLAATLFLDSLAKPLETAN